MIFSKNFTSKSKVIIKNFLLLFIPSFFIFFIMFNNINTKQNKIQLNIIGVKLVTLALLILFSFIISMLIYNRKKLDTKLDIAFQVFNDAKEAIIVTNENTNIIYANKSFSRITKYDVKEVIGKKTSAFKSGKHDNEFYRKMWESIINYGQWQGEVWDKKKNGNLYPKLLRISSVKSSTDNKIKYIGVFEDLTEIKTKKNEIKQLKYFDILTELPNIELLKKMIDTAIMNSNGNDLITLISIKITNFSIINDSFGNNIGNELILQIVSRLKLVVSEFDIVSRISSNEFGILLKNQKNINSIFKTADKLLTSLSEVFIVENEEIFIKAAIGLSSYNSEITYCEQLIETANIAREFSLQQGGEGYEFYKKDIKQKYLNRLDLETQLRKATENKEFILYYQPQVDVNLNKIIGMEALIRWNNPKLGIISPVKFIPLAEETGLIVPIGKWALEQAIKQTKAWHDMGFSNLTVAVNISPVQFKNCKITNIIKESLKKYNFPGKYLEVEITEGFLMENLNSIEKDLTKIKNMGIKIAIDDFGTGYSSLSYLKELNIDKIKIDREFIKDYPKDDDGTIAKTIVNLAQNLNLNVITEGVETDTQLKFIKDIKCNLVQGYYFSPPVNTHEFQHLISKKV